MNQIDPGKSLSLAPTIIRFGGIIVLIELVIFTSLFFYKRSKKSDTTWMIVIAVIVMALTLFSIFASSYFLVLPAYNLTN